MMKFFKGIDQLFLIGGNSESIYKSDYASQFELIGDQWHLKDYGFKDLRGVINYQTDYLMVFHNMDSPTQNIRYELEDRSIIWVENSSGIRFDVSLEKLALYYSYAWYGKEVHDGYNFASFNDLFPEKGTNSLLSYNTCSDTYNFVHGNETYFEQQINDYVFVHMPFDIGYLKVEVYDQKLNLIWVYEEKARCPHVKDINKFIDNDDSVIRNFKYERLKSTKISDTGQKNPRVEYVNGEVYCFVKSNGEILWKRKFDKQVDNLVAFDEQRILAFSNSKLHLLDRSNGEDLEIISTPFVYDLYKCPESRVLIHQGYLFLCHDAAKQLLIYHVETMQCIRQETIEALGSEINRLYALENKVYVSFNLHREILPTWSGLLEINCDDIQSPLEIEDDNVFKLIDSTAEDGCITLIADGLRIDDIVRLGEYQLLEQMQIYGKCFFNETTVNKDFNGCVKLVIRNCLTEPERVQEIVAMMEKRFEYFIKDAEIGRAHV
mgnify:CR=1 FL=1